MRILLAAVNAKYIHTNLAVRSLRCYARQCLAEEAGETGGTDLCDIAFSEYTINQREEDILADLYRRQPDVLCVSCYLWNFGLICRILENLHQIRPELPIWLGGPEVSFYSEECLGKFPWATGILFGEGEKSFTELVRYYLRAQAGEKKNCALPAVPKIKHAQKRDWPVRLEEVPGIVWRTPCGQIRRNSPPEPLPLDEVPFVYPEENLEEEDIPHRILYYETSRGCPFSCSYCLSSVEEKVRLRSLRLVERELQFFLDRRVPQVKFVDRTFNCNHSHAMAVWKYLREHDNGFTNFHFEIGADLLTEEEIALLNTLRPGQVQLEIGVQTTNPEVIREISRTMRLDVLERNVAAVRKGRNIHQHLDLIAGLPGENMESFRRSFNQVYAMQPDQLQLGFLKVLKGSAMYRKAGDYGILYRADPPYEVLQTPWLSYGELLRLKGVEEMLEIYGNSRQFAGTLQFLIPRAGTPFDFFDRLAAWYRDNHLSGKQYSRMERFGHLRKFSRENLLQAGEEQYLDESLTLDLYLRENSKSRPFWAGDPAEGRERFRAEADRILEKEDCAHPRRRLNSQLHGEVFHTDVLHTGQKGPWYVLFDYRSRNPLDGNARMISLT